MTASQDSIADALNVVRQVLADSIKARHWVTSKSAAYPTAIRILRTKEWFQRTDRKCSDWDTLELRPADWGKYLSEVNLLYRDRLEGGGSPSGDGPTDEAEISLAEVSQRFDVPLKELSLAWRRAPDDVNRLPARKVGRSVRVKVKDAKRFCDNYLARQDARKVGERQKGEKPTIKKALEAVRSQSVKKIGN